MSAPHFEVKRWHRDLQLLSAIYKWKQTTYICPGQRSKGDKRSLRALTGHNYTCGVKGDDSLDPKEGCDSGHGLSAAI